MTAAEHVRLLDGAVAGFADAVEAHDWDCARRFARIASLIQEEWDATAQGILEERDR